MAKYHINAKGETGVCKARKNCPFGDLEKDHYATKEKAQEAYEGFAKAYFQEKTHSKPVDEYFQGELFSEHDLDSGQDTLFEMEK